MLACAAGHTIGVAKKGSPVVVRLPWAGSIETFFESLKMIIADAKNIVGLKVLSISIDYRSYFPDGSLAYKNPDGSDKFDRMGSLMLDLLEDLVKQGVLPVLSSGNENDVSIRCL